MRKILSLLIAQSIFSVALFAQVGVGTSTPDASAKLEVNSSNQGFLPPRMTSVQRDAITTPADGLIIYNTTINRLEIRSASSWQTLTTLSGTDSLANKTINGSSNTITNVSLANGITGILPVTNGGTGQSTANASLNALLPSQSGNANKVLVTDGTNTTWNTNVALTSAVVGTMGSGAANTTQNSYTGASITLPNGKWSVSVSMLAVTSNTGDYWLRTGFSASSSAISLGADAVTGGPSLVSGFVHGGGLYTMLNGTVIINNTSGGNKTYHYCTGVTGVWNGGNSSAQFINLGRDSYGENSIVAYPMN